jgi:Fe2+ or Zn2+ uptake regulation protein
MAPADPDDPVVQALRGAGLRVTMPRQAVLTWLATHPHSTAEAIGTGVREQFGALSVQAIYDVLAACTTAGLLRRIEPAGHSARYERRVGDNHHHVVCRRCGRAEDVDCAVGERPCLTPADGHGYAIDEAEVVFWGLCPSCLAAEGSPSGTEYHEEEWL